jgi:hypothetical protein
LDLELGVHYIWSNEKDPEQRRVLEVPLRYTLAFCDLIEVRLESSMSDEFFDGRENVSFGFSEFSLVRVVRSSPLLRRHSSNRSSPPIHFSLLHDMEHRSLEIVARRVRLTGGHPEAYI